MVLAGRVGSAFAAEIGTMKVSEQIDALQILKTDPVDYLVTPRVLSCFFYAPYINDVFFGGGYYGRIDYCGVFVRYS